MLLGSWEEGGRGLQLVPTSAVLLHGWKHRPVHALIVCVPTTAVVGARALPFFSMIGPQTLEETRCEPSLTSRVPTTAAGSRRSLNYRHGFHAGNFADVFKHTVLLGVLK